MIFQRGGNQFGERISLEENPVKCGNYVSKFFQFLTIKNSSGKFYFDIGIEAGENKFVFGLDIEQIAGKWDQSDKSISIVFVSTYKKLPVESKKSGASHILN